MSDGYVWSDEQTQERVDKFYYSPPISRFIKIKSVHGFPSLSCVQNYIWTEPVRLAVGQTEQLYYPHCR
jgi:hypothetical protein